MPTPSRRFVILSIMRTGSNLLEQMINSIEGVTCHPELLNQPQVHSSVRHLLEGDRPAIRPALRTEKPREYLNALLDNTPADHVGFRIFPDHNNPILKELVENPDVHKIILTRNLLESYVSLQIAQQNNQWIMNHVGTRKAWSPITIEMGDFKNYALKNSAYYYRIISRCHHTGQQTTPIEYNQLTEPSTLRRLLAHFGPERAVHSEKVTALRQNPESLEEKIKNYGEVMKVINRLRLDDWLFD